MAFYGKIPNVSQTFTVSMMDIAAILRCKIMNIVEKNGNNPPKKKTISSAVMATFLRRFFDGILHDFRVQRVDQKVPLESSIFDDIPMMIPMLYP